jgi:peptidoglycan/xylan/chitin deacetylase (PgdA/CDA1 family)
MKVVARVYNIALRTMFGWLARYRSGGRGGLKKGSRRLAVLGAVVALFHAVTAHAVTRVLFTIDVESNAVFALPQQVTTLCRNGVACGLMRVASMLKERGWAGTFFLNVYEHRRWGDAAMRNVTTKLQAAGQDVALHTHPQWAFDRSRNEMYQYNLKEQTEIIRAGVTLLSAWTGLPVVAHRAGDYSANEYTLEALKRNGLRVDSSLLSGNPHCRLTGLGLPRNLPSSLGHLTEIPVTVYEREERPRGFGDVFAPVMSVRKFDVNWFLNPEEARTAINRAVEADLPFLVIFLHSFSLLAGKESGGVPVLNRRAVDIFRAILDQVANKRLPVVTMRDLAESGSLRATRRDKDVIPRVTVRMDLYRYLWHRVRADGTGALEVGAVVLLIIAGTALLIMARWRKLLPNRRDDRWRGP